MATLEQKKETYQKIMLMMNHIGQMIEAIEHPVVKNNEEQLHVAEEFILTISESTETILNAYMEYVQRGSAPTNEESKTIEKAARKIFIEMTKFIDKAKQLKPAA